MDFYFLFKATAKETKTVSCFFGLRGSKEHLPRTMYVANALGVRNGHVRRTCPFLTHMLGGGHEHGAKLLGA